MNTDQITATNQPGIFLGLGSYWRGCYRGRTERQLIGLVEVFEACPGEYFSAPQSRVIDVEV